MVEWNFRTLMALLISEPGGGRQAEVIDVDSIRP